MVVAVAAVVDGVSVAAVVVAAVGLVAAVAVTGTIAAVVMAMASLLRAATGARAGAGQSARIDRLIARSLRAEGITRCAGLRRTSFHFDDAFLSAARPVAIRIFGSPTRAQGASRHRRRRPGHLSRLIQSAG